MSNSIEQHLLKSLWHGFNHLSFTFCEVAIFEFIFEALCQLLAANKTLNRQAQGVSYVFVTQTAHYHCVPLGQIPNRNSI